MATVGQVTVDVSANTAKLQSGMNKAQQQMKNSVYKMKKSLGILTGALAAVGGVSGFGVMIKSQIDAADRTAKLASKLSMTTESLSSLQYAAKFSGVEIGGLDSALSAMTRRLNNFARTGGGAAKTALEELGFTQEQIQSYKSADKAFIAIADRLSKLAPGMQKTAIAQDIFSKSAASIIPLLNEGSEGIERFRKEAERMGLVISDDFAKSSEALNDNLDVLKSVFDGATQSIAERFTPSLLKATRSLQDFLDVQYDLSKIETVNRIRDIGEELDELRQRVKSQPLIATSFYAEMSTLSTELARLKGELADINKQENMPTVTITRTLKEKKETKTKETKTKETKDKTDYSLDFISRLKANQDFLEKQKKAAESFSESMTYTLAEPYEKLMITREKYLKEHGNNAKARLLTEQWYSSELEKLNNEEVKNFTKLQEDKTKKSVDEAKKAADAIYESFNGISRQLETSFTGFFDATSKQFMDFGSLAKDILNQIYIEIIRVQLVKPLVSGIMSGVSGIFGSAKGNVFNNGAPQQFAKGGLPFGSNLQFAMAGGGVGSMNEQGQEAIMPLTRGAGGVLGVKAIGGTQNAGNTIINIKNESGTPIDMRTISESMNNGDRTIEVVMKAIERNPDMRNAIKGIR